MDDEMRDIAARIREMREISDLSAGRMAGELGVPVEQYERYESTGGDIPISALYRIANVFRVDMSVLLTGKTSHIDDFCVVRAGQGLKIDRYPGYAFRGLAYKFRNKIMEPMIVTVDPSGEDPALVRHPGQELNLVLEGGIEVLFNDKRIALDTGDSIYFDPTHPHGQKAAGGKPAKFLTVIAE